MMYYFFIILLIIVCRYYYKRIISRERNLTDISLPEQINTDITELFIQNYIMANNKYIIRNQGKNKIYRARNY